MSREGTVEARPVLISLLEELRIQGFPGSRGLRLGEEGRGQGQHIALSRES